MASHHALFGVKIFSSVLTFILSAAPWVQASKIKSLPPSIRPSALQRVGRKAKKMALIPGATFDIGTDVTEIPRLQRLFGISRADLFSAEVPQHAVTIDSFYLDKYEVTNARFKRFLDKNPAWRRDRIHARYHNGNYLKHWEGNSYPKG